MEKRTIYLTNLSVEDAQTRFFMRLQLRQKPEVEQIEVIQSLGRQTVGPVFANCNSPLWDNAAMDGVMVSSKCTEGASETSPIHLRRGKDYFPVNTGDLIRPPFDAVIMSENIQEAGDDSILIRQGAAPWQHVRPVGEDIVQGEMVLPSNHTIRPVDIGALLSGGLTHVAVKQLVRVAILPTGSELIESGQAPKPGDIIESNSHMLAGLIQSGGGSPTRFPIVPDVYEEIKAALQTALEQHDVVLICSGTSAGTKDYTIHVLEELGEVIVHGVAMKPGKPVILSVVKGKPVIGIPGYPVSAYLAYKNFVAPILHTLSGETQVWANSVDLNLFSPAAGGEKQEIQQRVCPLSETQAEEPKISAAVTSRIVSSLQHREYIRVKVGRIGDDWVATPLPRGAGAAMSLVGADGFCIVPQNCEGIEPGMNAEIILSRDLEALKNTLVSIGSHDLILDVIADAMPKLYPGISLSSSHVGSMGGLLALRRGEAHIAPTHQLDDKTGTYNIPMIKQLFPGEQMVLIKGVGRTQGLLVKQGNPLRIETIKDLQRCRFINRQRGAGTRMLLDYKLKRAHIDSSEIVGYERESATHMAVAAAIASGSADVGMGILSAAHAMGLAFIPIAEEAYDFVTFASFLELPHMCAFIELLRNQALHEEIHRLGGYDLTGCGEICRIDC